MPKLIILGSANAVPDEDHENTHMLLVGRENIILIDCVSNPIIRLRRIGLDIFNLSDLILTHFHPDHVSGVPLLLMNMWLMGRQSPLRIHGLDHTLERMEKLMEAYEWRAWPDFFPVSFNRLPHQELRPVVATDEWRVFASPVQHLIPTIGLRVEFPESGRSLAYSCDTEPCQQVVRLAKKADVLIHEATGDSLGHTSPQQAGQIASQAGARSLYLIHYPTDPALHSLWIARASETYHGPVCLAEDFLDLDF
jgi:ribonuclease Z